jgi:hypothetical protein
VRPLMLSILLCTVCLASSSCTSLFAQEQVFKGVYVWGAEVSSFTPCGSDVDYWVRYSNMQSISERYEKATTHPYQPVFMRLRGSISDESRTGFAADYDGTLYISEVFAFELSVPESCNRP